MQIGVQKLKEKLTDEQYDVCFNKGTEPAFSGKYHDCKDKGMYKCVCCGEELFESDTKFDSGTGWPSFHSLINNKGVLLTKEKSMFGSQVEVKCAKCKSHLGHVYEDAPQTPTGKRYCINSVCLDFKKN